MYATTNADAHIRAPIESIWGNRRNMSWWDESMASLFRPDRIIGLDDIQAAYDQLSERFRAELYVTHQTRPLVKPSPSLITHGSWLPVGATAGRVVDLDFESVMGLSVIADRH